MTFRELIKKLTGRHRGWRLCGELGSDPLQLWNYIIKRSGEFNVFISVARPDDSKKLGQVFLPRPDTIGLIAERWAPRSNGIANRRVTCIARRQRFPPPLSRSQTAWIRCSALPVPPAVQYLRAIRIIFLTPRRRIVKHSTSTYSWHLTLSAGCCGAFPRRLHAENVYVVVKLVSKVVNKHERVECSSNT